MELLKNEIFHQYIEDTFLRITNEKVYAFYDNEYGESINIIFDSDFKGEYLKEQIKNIDTIYEQYRYSIFFIDEKNVYSFSYLTCTPQTWEEPEFCDMIDYDTNYSGIEEVLHGLLLFHINDSIEPYSVYYNHKQSELSQVKYLFLDIDGVITTDNEIMLDLNSEKWDNEFNCIPLNRDCIKSLNHICKYTNTRVIITSDWLFGFDYYTIGNVFKKYGFNHNIFDGISRDTLFNKSPDIINYLKDKSFIENYVVVDDIDYSKTFDNKFVYVRDTSLGLNNEQIINKIINKLNKYD